jgi:hypothetical protein
MLGITMTSPVFGGVPPGLGPPEPPASPSGGVSPPPPPLPPVLTLSTRDLHPHPTSLSVSKPNRVLPSESITTVVATPVEISLHAI